MKLIKVGTRVDSFEYHVFEIHSRCCFCDLFFYCQVIFYSKNIPQFVFYTPVKMNIWGVSRLRLLCIKAP